MVCHVTTGSPSSLAHGEAKERQITLTKIEIRPSFEDVVTGGTFSLLLGQCCVDGSV